MKKLVNVESDYNLLSNIGRFWGEHVANQRTMSGTACYKEQHCRKGLPALCYIVLGKEE